MRELIEQYRTQLRILEERKRKLAAEKQRLRGREYFQALRRLDVLEQESLEMACTLAWMAREYGERSGESGIKRRQAEAACS